MDYPKMLYKGNTTDYQHIIADDEDHETSLKDGGYVDFADLEDGVDQTSMAVGSISDHDLKNAVVPIEQFDAISEKLVSLELQLNVAQTERDENIEEVARLNGVIERGSAENVELRKRIDELSTPIDAIAPKITQAKAK